MKNVKKCRQCSSIFKRKKTEGPQYWKTKKYCSNRCAVLSPERIERIKQSIRIGFSLGREAWNKNKKGLQVAWNKGKGEYAKKLGFGKWMKGRKGEQIGNWKGEEVGYGALHDWVYRELGRPKKCTHCELKSNNPWRMHWANISNKYKRNLRDWIRLCAKCHKKFDKGRKQIKFKRNY